MNQRLSTTRICGRDEQEGKDVDGKETLPRN